MTVYFHDYFGAVAVKVNEHGITFDRELGLAMFEDTNGTPYKLKIFDLELITTE